MLNVFDQRYGQDHAGAQKIRSDMEDGRLNIHVLSIVVSPEAVRNYHIGQKIAARYGHQELP